MNQQERIAAMANIMVQARRANEDIGELVAAALHDAGEKLGGIDRLVTGRPGSWEANITLNMAHAGGSGNARRVKALASLFVQMGQATEDGGDILSQAMGQAVDQLGGLAQFAGDNRWFHDLVNIGRQYSQHWDSPIY